MDRAVTNIERLVSLLSENISLQNQHLQLQIQQHQSPPQTQYFPQTFPQMYQFRANTPPSVFQPYPNVITNAASPIYPTASTPVTQAPQPEPVTTQAESSSENQDA